MVVVCAYSSHDLQILHQPQHRGPESPTDRIQTRVRSQAKGARSLEKNGQEVEIREFKQIKNWLMLLIKKKKETRNRRKANLGGRERLRLSAPHKAGGELSVRK